MINVTCSECGSVFSKHPSRVHKGIKNLCSTKCQTLFRVRHLRKVGKKYRLKKGHTLNSKEHYSKLASLLKNDGHPKWKGEQVSYRGLHQWVRRNKGHGGKCSMCGFESSKPRMIQWANRDGKYHRNLDDYFPLCGSCHKIYDRSLKGLPWKGLRGKSTQGGLSATQ